jgi:hypothetical protein
MKRLLRGGRCPHHRPEEGVGDRTTARVGAALSADRRRPATPTGNIGTVPSRDNGERPSRLPSVQRI